MGDFARRNPAASRALDLSPGRRSPGGVVLPRATPRGEIQPGVISTEHADTKGISSRRVRFDRQGLAYDGTTYTLITVAGSAAWNRVGGSTGHMYLQLGSFSYDAIIYAWGSFAWANDDGTGTFTGHSCLVLYDFDGTDYNVVRRADNLSPPNWLNNDNNFVQFSSFSQFILPADSGGDFWIGMQCQNTGANSHTQQRHRDQSLMAFAVALDPEQPDNLTADATLE